MAKRTRQASGRGSTPAADALAPTALEERREHVETAGWSDEAIASRAYQIYQARGGEHGRDLDDWLQAEAELRQRRASRGTSDDESR
jgi:hypothetical protein